MKREKKKILYKTISELELAIKNHCYECNGGVKKIDCGLTSCKLYKFRPWSHFRKHLFKDL